MWIVFWALFAACVAMLVTIAVHQIGLRRTAVDTEEKAYGLWQFNQPTVSSSSSTFNYNPGKINLSITRASVKKAKLEQRRRVRVFEQHQDPEGTDAEMHDYHEWIERPKRTTVLRDSLCRENHNADRIWVLWVCNNPLCPAYAYVAEAKIEEVVLGWLDKAAPKPETVTTMSVWPDPHTPPAFAYSPWTTFSVPSSTYSTLTSNAMISGS